MAALRARPCWRAEGPTHPAEAGNLSGSLVVQTLGWNDRITYVASEAKDRLGLSAVLVRPDGFVAWAGAGEAAANHEEAAEAAARWFGKPEDVHGFS